MQVDKNMLPNFFYHPRMLSYDFGPQHPLRPERLRRAIKLLEFYGVEPLDPGLATEQDLLRVHSREYIRAVQSISEGASAEGFWGFGSGDNPPFEGMYEASLAYTGGSVRAAEAVRDGAQLAFSLSGGLHHARRDQASGFCIFNDPAVACAILRDRFERVAYVDIDVHHGDGVQWIFYDDPTVLTCSIHQDGRTIYPGTGFVDESSVDFTAVNVPMVPGTTGDVWIDAFNQTIIPAIKAFNPGAIVLQMGTDAHFLDRLGNLRLVAQEWLEAVMAIKNLGLPIVALGGGGYTITTVPRMWAAACLTLGGIPFEDDLPADLIQELETDLFFDPELPGPREQGREHADKVRAALRSQRLA